MNALHRPGRAVAAVGAAVAVGAATLAVIAGTAAAAEPGRCTDNVNVRAEPSRSAEILRVCETGTPVQVGETRNGFVQLVDLGGWSKAEFVSVDSAAADPTSATDEADAATSPGSDTGRTTPAEEADTGDSTGDTGDTTDTTDATDTGDSTGEAGGSADATGSGDDDQRFVPQANDGTGDQGSTGDEPSGDAPAGDEAESGGGSPLDALPLP